MAVHVQYKLLHHDIMHYVYKILILSLKWDFFIRNLYQQIKELHAKVNHKRSLTVYRGQNLINENFK